LIEIREYVTPGAGDEPPALGAAAGFLMSQEPDPRVDVQCPSRPSHVAVAVLSGVSAHEPPVTFPDASVVVLHVPLFVPVLST
jgi:hypothetical protein